MEKRVLSLRQGWVAWSAAILLVILAVADVVGTEIHIDMGGEEQNPLWAWLMSKIGVWWVVPKVLLNTVASLFLLAYWQIRLARIGMVVCILVYAAVVALHVWLIVAHGG